LALGIFRIGSAKADAHTMTTPRWFEEFPNRAENEDKLFFQPLKINGGKYFNPGGGRGNSPKPWRARTVQTTIRSTWGEPGPFLNDKRTGFFLALDKDSRVASPVPSSVCYSGVGNPSFVFK